MRGNSTNPPASTPCMAHDALPIHGFRLLKVPLDSNRLSSNIPALLVFTTDTGPSKLAPAILHHAHGVRSFRPALAKGWEEKSGEVVNCGVDEIGQCPRFASVFWTPTWVEAITTEGDAMRGFVKPPQTTWQERNLHPSGCPVH